MELTTLLVRLELPEEAKGVWDPVAHLDLAALAGDGGRAGLFAPEALATLIGVRVAQDVLRLLAEARFDLGTRQADYALTALNAIPSCL